MRERIVVMNDPHAMRINKELAGEIGFQDSVVFLQLEYLIANSGAVIAGADGTPRRWKRMALKDLQEYHFPWWSAATILRVLNRLEERGLLLRDEHNELGYDRTQWYAIDETGVRELRSVAIFQNEECIPQDANQHVSDCKMEIGKMKSPDSQNETTIRKEVVQEPKETPPDGGAKKAGSAGASPPSKKIGKLTEDEADRRWRGLCGSDPHGAELRRLAELMAEENATGEVAVTRVWREIGERYLANRERYGMSEEAWAHGFEQAIAKPAPNIGYVTIAAKGHRPARNGAGGRAGRRPSDSIAVVGATEDDYREEDYRFHA